MLKTIKQLSLVCILLLGCLGYAQNAKAGEPDACVGFTCPECTGTAWVDTTLPTNCASGGNDAQAYDSAVGGFGAICSVDCDPVLGGDAGVCGAANGTTPGSAPSSGLCSQGTPSSVSAGSVSGTWTWTCSGTSSTSSCTTVVGGSGGCGGMSDYDESACDQQGGTPGLQPGAHNYTACEANEKAFEDGGSTCDDGYSGFATFRGSHCQVDASCSSLVNGTCGTSHGGTFGNSTPPTTNLCGDGSTPSVTTNAGTYDWTCNGSGGGSNASCSATRAASGTTCCVSFRCSNGNTWDDQDFAETQTLASCSDGLGDDSVCGTLTPGLFTSGGTTVTSGACGTPPVVNGSCAATHNNCTTGTATDLADTGTHYQWRCDGSGGGSNSPTCQEAIPAVPVAGTCGTAAGQSFSSAPTGNLCANGDGVATPAPSGSGPWSWTCGGSGGGASSGTCTATQTAVTAGCYTIQTRSCGTLVSPAPTCNVGYTAGAPWNEDDCGFGGMSTYKECCPSAPPVVNGTCGTANGVPSTTSPSSGLCATGTGASMLAVGSNWTWSCNGSGGGTNASCSAPIMVNAVCGASHGGTFGNTTPPTVNFCNAGTTSAVTTNPTTYTWTCNGSGTGSNASCSATRSAAVVNGVCAGTSNTCTTGTPASYVAGSCGGNQTWDCNGSGGGTNASCTLANAACPINGTCGTAHGTTTTTAPASGAARCGTGTETAVTDTGTTFTWNCNGLYGGTSASCSAGKIVNGTCGVANMVGSSTAPVAGQCATGSATAATNTNPIKWKWDCNGLNGGSTANCMAPAFTCSSAKFQCKVPQNRKTGRDYTYIIEVDMSNTFVSTYHFASAPNFTWSYNPDWRYWGSVRNCNDFEVKVSGVDMSCTTSRTGGVQACNFYNASLMTSGLNGAYTPTASCSGNDGVCGAAHGTYVTAAPTVNLCSLGSSSAVAGTGPWTWTCAGSGGGSTASCRSLAKVSGVCGAANGVATGSAPAAGLCTAGTASAVSGSAPGPWTWTCTGANSGSTATCNAPPPAPAPSFGGACPA